MIKEYKCNKCNVKTEIFAQISSAFPAELNCFKCSGKMLPIISIPLKPVLKGSGFYETDYKKK